MISQPILATRRGRCPGCNAVIQVDEQIVHDDVTDSWFHEECSPAEEKSDIEVMRYALQRLGIPTDDLTDEQVVAATRATFEACAKFGAALHHLFENAAKDLAERFVRLGTFCEEVQRLVEREQTKGSS